MADENPAFRSFTCWDDAYDLHADEVDPKVERSANASAAALVYGARHLGKAPHQSEVHVAVRSEDGVVEVFEVQVQRSYWVKPAPARTASLLAGDDRRRQAAIIKNAEPGPDE